MNNKERSKHPSLKTPLSSFSSFRGQSSLSSRHHNYAKERAGKNLKFQSYYTLSFDRSQISSPSPTPSLTSGYVSTSSDHVAGNSPSTNNKVIETSYSKPGKILLLVRHPSLPDKENDWEETFSETGDFTFSDFDQSSLETGIANLGLDSPEFLISANESPQINYTPLDEPLYIQMDKTSPKLSNQMPSMSDFNHSDFYQPNLVSEIDNLDLEYPKLLTSDNDPPQKNLRNKDEPLYIEMQKSSPSLSKTPQKPKELSSAATKCYLQIYDHARHPSLETRQSQADFEDRTDSGSPVSEPNKPKETEVTEQVKQVKSSNFQSFLSWMSSKAGRGTSFISDVLPTRSKEDFHLVMIGLDGAGKTTVLYRMKHDQYKSTVPTIGFNCERVKGTIGRSSGLTFLVWDVGGQEKIRPLWRS